MSPALEDRGMPARDFFFFCTSLPPAELRAVGALSKVRHLPAGATIFRPGDAGSEFYIINRGLVELLPESAHNRGEAATFLSRGDIFGELEVLTEGLRTDLARARQAVSLQCFEREHFDELLQRVPTFFRFLCQDLARRLGQVRAAPVLPAQQTLQLSGTLAHFDLVTIYQTIVHSSQTGRLSIRCEDGHPMAGFHFVSGQPRTGHFLHLHGEEALWQLFLAEDLTGTFSFAAGEQEPAEPSHHPPIARAANDLLFNAIRNRDEFQALKATTPPRSMLEVRRLQLDQGALQTALPLSLLEEIWRHLSASRRSIAELFSFCSVSELKIQQAVSELLRTEHLSLIPAPTPSLNLTPHE